MKLHQHPDFRDAVIAAEKYFESKGIANQLIEKDYYVTEALRTIANRWESQVIFKGGTSLSKGWQLIDYLRYATRTIFRRYRFISQQTSFYSTFGS